MWKVDDDFRAQEQLEQTWRLLSRRGILERWRRLNDPDFAAENANTSVQTFGDELDDHSPDLPDEVSTQAPDYQQLERWMLHLSHRTSLSLC